MSAGGLARCAVDVVACMSATTVCGARLEHALAKPASRRARSAEADKWSDS